MLYILLMYLLKFQSSCHLAEMIVASNFHPTILTFVVKFILYSMKETDELLFIGLQIQCMYSYSFSPVFMSIKY